MSGRTDQKKAGRAGEKTEAVRTVKVSVNGRELTVKVPKDVKVDEEITGLSWETKRSGRTTVLLALTADEGTDRLVTGAAVVETGGNVGVIIYRRTDKGFIRSRVKVSPEYWEALKVVTDLALKVTADIKAQLKTAEALEYLKALKAQGINVEELIKKL